MKWAVSGDGEYLEKMDRVIPFEKYYLHPEYQADGRG